MSPLHCVILYHNIQDANAGHRSPLRDELSRFILCNRSALASVRAVSPRSLNDGQMKRYIVSFCCYTQVDGLIIPPLTQLQRAAHILASPTNSTATVCPGARPFNASASARRLKVLTPPSATSR
jgi:hypothetical protein